MTTYAYEINPRPAHLGGGWRLRLLEGGEEVGGGVYPAHEKYRDAFNEATAEDVAYVDALNEATAWLETRPGR